MCRSAGGFFLVFLLACPLQLHIKPILSHILISCSDQPCESSIHKGEGASCLLSTSNGTSESSLYCNYHNGDTNYHLKRASPPVESAGRPLADRATCHWSCCLPFCIAVCPSLRLRAVRPTSFNSVTKSQQGARHQIDTVKAFKHSINLSEFDSTAVHPHPSIHIDSCMYPSGNGSECEERASTQVAGRCISNKKECSKWRGSILHRTSLYYAAKAAWSRTW